MCVIFKFSDQNVNLSVLHNEVCFLMEEFYDHLVQVFNSLISQGPQLTLYSVFSLPPSYMLLMGFFL